ncbi:MAG: hypothetical protein HY927_02675 [Elusimicrobia bacterium]|nr:hypothetical protein [Elusimicrobiota bacterium]
MALLAGPGYAADEVLIESAPYRRPLFTELYRQSLYAAARYRYGLQAYDAELSSPRLAGFAVSFEESAGELRIALRIQDTSLNELAVPYPEERWDILAEIKRAGDTATALLDAKWAPVAGPPRPTNDIGRAESGFEALDVYALIWTINTLAEAQRDRPPWPDALRMMARAYGWLGKFNNGIPSNKAKIFHARALALSDLAERLSVGASSEKAFALTLCGRDSDALFVISQSTPDSPDLSSLAGVMARQDLGAARPQGKAGKSREWKYAYAMLADYHAKGLESREAFKALVESNPLDLNSLNWLVGIADVGPNHLLTRQLLGTALGWEPYLETVMGRRAPAGLAYPLSRPPPDATGFLNALSRLPPGDPAEEIPMRTRVELAKDYALEAALSMMAFLEYNYGVPDQAKEQLKTFQPLVTGHPWGFLLPLVKPDLDKDQDAGRTLSEGLARVKLQYGGMRHLVKYIMHVFESDINAIVADRRLEFDDVRLDLRERALIPDERTAAARRTMELSPYDPWPYHKIAKAEGNPRVFEDAMARLGDSPAFLQSMISFILHRPPLDQNRYATVLDRLLAADPGNWMARTNKGILLISQDRLLEAIENWRGYLKVDSESLEAASAVCVMAWIYRLMGHPDLARRLSLSAAPTYKAQALFELAYAFEDDGRYDLAERMIRAARQRYGEKFIQSLAKFYLRTGDPRGRSLLKAHIRRFFSMQSAGRILLTDRMHLDLLECFLLTGQWVKAYGLLNQVLVPRWHPNSAKFGLWTVVSMMKAGPAYGEATESLKALRPNIPSTDPLLPLARLYLEEQGVAETLPSPSDAPSVRSLFYYFVGQYLMYRKGEPGKGREFFEKTVRLKQFENPEYYLSLKELGRAPCMADRLRRQFTAWLRDIGKIHERMECVKRLREARQHG